MTIQFQTIAPCEYARLMPVLACYLTETAPGHAIDVAQKAKRALNRAETTALWINAERQCIGFALLLDLPEGQKELSEFTIFPRFRRQGFGQKAATMLFTVRPGVWRLGISRHSDQAIGFWGTCLSVIPQITNLKTGAPVTSRQSKCFSFSVGQAANIEHQSAASSQHTV